MSEPISVVMAAYQAERYVGEAIESVLTQSRPPDELVVAVDAKSDDATGAIVAGFGSAVRVLPSAGPGYAATTNDAVAVARFPLLGFQDADDVWCPGRLELQAGSLEADDQLDAVYGHVETFLSPDLPPAQAARFRVPPPMLSHQLASTLLRRSAFDRVGPLDPTTVTSALIDWVSRSRLCGFRTVDLPAVVLRRRIHGGNMGVRHADERRTELLDVLRVHRQRMHRLSDRDPG